MTRLLLIISAPIDIDVNWVHYTPTPSTESTMLKYFQKSTVAQVVAAELEELQRELYKQDLLRDHHQAQCDAIAKRIAKLKQWGSAS